MVCHGQRLVGGLWGWGDMKALGESPQEFRQLALGADGVETEAGHWEPQRGSGG